MKESDPADRLRLAAEAFDARASRGDGARVAYGLSRSLTQLKEVLFRRLHADVESRFGTDSMYVPVSEAVTTRP